MDQLYDVAIKPAIKQQGLAPYHVGRDPGVNKIDDAILEAIDRSALVVVDLTHDPRTGLRGSVIFEAGYAYRTKPVIWMCRDDLTDSTPFDIRQFRQLRWHRSRLLEAQEQLAQVIRERFAEQHIRKEDHELSRLISAKWQAIVSAQDLPPAPGDGEVISADRQRAIVFLDLCDDLKTRVKYKEMGLSQDEKYELIEIVREFMKWINLVRPYDKVFGMDFYNEHVYPPLRASGWIA